MEVTNNTVIVAKLALCPYQTLEEEAESCRYLAALEFLVDAYKDARRQKQLKPIPVKHRSMQGSYYWSFSKDTVME